jgi:hypothetical protein
MQMSALEEHNNSLLHKEALRLQMASKEKLQPPEIERPPVYVKGWCCCRLVDPSFCNYTSVSPSDSCDDWLFVIQFVPKTSMPFEYLRKYVIF